MLLISPDNTCRKTPTRRDDPIKCATCGRVVPRASRRQKFCSAACRQRAFQKNGRGANIFDVPDQHTGRVTNPRKNPNDNRPFQTAKAGSRARINGPRRIVEREVISGREWREATSSDGVRVRVTRLERRRP
jgi:endogenous inhibitor of DNA gyrase (YacG/DUF329 family)